MYLIDRMQREISLNVGGKTFRTTRATLRRYEDTFFSCMLKEDGGFAELEEDEIFIDRGRTTYFFHVSN